MALDSASGWMRGSASRSASAPRPETADATALGTHQRGERRDQLGHVLRQPAVGGGGLRKAEVDHPRSTVVADEHVGAAQVAVREAGVPETRHLLPQRCEQPIVDVLGREGVERPAHHPALGQERVTRPRVDGQHHRGRLHACPLREQRDVGLVLDLALGRRERRFVLELAVHQRAPRLEQRVGVALLAADDLDEQLVTALGGHEERSGAPCVDRGRRHRDRAEPGA